MCSNHIKLGGNVRLLKDVKKTSAMEMAKKRKNARGLHFFEVCLTFGEGGSGPGLDQFKRNVN